MHSNIPDDSFSIRLWNQQRERPICFDVWLLCALRSVCKFQKWKKAAIFREIILFANKGIVAEL